ncbi:hypothetical protein HK097_003033, partial [Rhizophlyctis rosea]
MEQTLWPPAGLVNPFEWPLLSENNNNNNGYWNNWPTIANPYYNDTTTNGSPTTTNEYAFSPSYPAQSPYSLDVYSSSGTETTLSDHGYGFEQGMVPELPDDDDLFAVFGLGNGGEVTGRDGQREAIAQFIAATLQRKYNCKHSKRKTSSSSAAANEDNNVTADQFMLQPMESIANELSTPTLTNAMTPLNLDSDVPPRQGFPLMPMTQLLTESEHHAAKRTKSKRHTTKTEKLTKTGRHKNRQRRTRLQRDRSMSVTPEEVNPTPPSPHSFTSKIKHLVPFTTPKSKPWLRSLHTLGAAPSQRLADTQTIQHFLSRHPRWTEDETSFLMASVRQGRTLEDVTDDINRHWQRTVKQVYDKVVREFKGGLEREEEGRQDGGQE